MEQHKQDLTFLFVDQGQDWSIKAINAAIEKKGTTLPSLSLSSGLVEGSQNAFTGTARNMNKLLLILSVLNLPSFGQAAT